MKILHYGIGLPPERSGGLTIYAIDLMKEQAASGEEVYFLFPGKLNFLKNYSYIKKNQRLDKFEIQAYELINSLPLPLRDGISTPKSFMKKNNKCLYEKFFSTIMPDVIHVHTLMGIHKEFFEIAKNNGIQIIYTSHDYFGLSPIPNFFFKGKSWDKENSIEFWQAVSIEAMPVWKLRLFQTTIYPFIRKIIKKKSRVVEWRASESIESLPIYDFDSSPDFTSLRKYYLEIFKLIDKFHFNSTTAKEVFEYNLSRIDNYEIISITNSQIKNKVIFNEKLDKDKIKIGYIGPYTEYKGFFEFLKFAEANISNSNLEFHIWGDNQNAELPQNTQNHQRYEHSQVNEIFSSLNLLIVPSIWKETFSFLALEGMSFGVKVMVSSRVGAKDLLSEDWVFDSIFNINVEKAILSENENVEIKEISIHSQEILRVYEDMAKDYLV